MPISPGARLGSYEVFSLLGAGGMGEVYKARDTRLDRTVAIKVLPSHLREENADVWTYDLARGSLTRLTFDPGEDEMPVWMPDGERIVFAGDRGGVRKIFSKTSDGSGTEEEVLGSQGGHLHSVSVSPDGKVLAYTKVSINSGIDIWVTTLHGDQLRSLQLLLQL